MKLFLLLPLLLIGYGCAIHTPSQNESAMIVFKTPILRYADQGFIRRGKTWVHLQIYTAGNAPFALDIGKRICLSTIGCMDEKRFYHQWMGVDYPRGTLANILNKKPIFNGSSLTQKGATTLQNITSESYNILYRYDPYKTYFVDKKNGILVQIIQTPQRHKKP